MTSPSQPIRSEGRFSCVVDEDPRFHLDALRWFASLTKLAGVDPRDLVIGTVGAEHSDVLDYLRGLGVSVQPIEPFDWRSPHCNKISGALRLAQDPVPGYAVLCDTDIAVLEDPRRISLPAGTIGGKVVDAPVPPLDVILRVFKASSVPPPPIVQLPWGSGEQTVSGNSNGGLYLVPGSLLGRVASAWANRARWLLDRLELLEDWTVYIDQVAMAVALAAEGIPASALDVRWNMPTHDPSRLPSDPPVPSIVHYHQEVDRRGLIKATGRPSIDAQLERVNDAIREVWDRGRPHVTYKRWLADRPRDDGLDDVITKLVDVLGANTVLDVGPESGIEWGTRSIEVTALDGPEVLANLARRDSASDVVLCLEQVTDNGKPEKYRELVRQLWRSTARALVVRAPEGSSGFAMQSAESFIEFLNEAAPEGEFYPLTVDHSLLVIALRRPSTKHPRDFGPATLAPLVAHHPDPFGLLVLRVHALETTTFYPDHAPRLWEYPVVADLVCDRLPQGSRLVDIGAGVTPLAPFLASSGYIVETVDPSPVVRRWPPKQDWNEWDFLDYGAVGLAHRSWNCTLDQIPRQALFDGAYSVSVIEHVPAEDRRRLLAEIASRIRPGGLVVLTIDLVRDTDDLWNLNLGVVVEKLSDHGRLENVIDECRAVGLDVFRQETVRSWGETRVDIALLALEKMDAPAEAVDRSRSTIEGGRRRSWRHLGRRRRTEDGMGLRQK